MTPEEYEEKLEQRYNQAPPIDFLVIALTSLQIAARRLGASDWGAKASKLAEQTEFLIDSIQIGRDTSSD